MNDGTRPPGWMITALSPAFGSQAWSSSQSCSAPPGSASSSRIYRQTWSVMNRYTSRAGRPDLDSPPVQGHVVAVDDQFINRPLRQVGQVRTEGTSTPRSDVTC